MIVTAACICPNLALWMIDLQLKQRQHRFSEKKVNTAHSCTVLSNVFIFIQKQMSRAPPQKISAYAPVLIRLKS